jgi:ABC-type sulfate transport system substrate-binding protein
MDEYDWLDELEAEKNGRTVEEARQKRAQAYFNVFTSPEGQKILEEWVSRFCTGAVPDATASVRECAMRDGKQQLIKEILDQIAITQQPRE